MRIYGYHQGCFAREEQSLHMGTIKIPATTPKLRN